MKKKEEKAMEKLMIENSLMNELKRLKNENFKLKQILNKLEKEKDKLKLLDEMDSLMDNLKLEPLPSAFLKELQDFFNSRKTTPTIINYKKE